MTSPEKCFLNSFRKAFSDAKKSTMQTPFSVEATKTFLNKDESKKA
jgi:hypothetical protein